MKADARFSYSFICLFKSSVIAQGISLSVCSFAYKRKTQQEKLSMRIAEIQKLNKIISEFRRALNLAVWNLTALGLAAASDLELSVFSLKALSNRLNEALGSDLLRRYSLAEADQILCHNAVIQGFYASGL